MPEYTFRLTCVLQILEDDLQLAEALFFPEVSRFGNRSDKLKGALKENAVYLTEDGATLRLSRRRAVAPSAPLNLPRRRLSSSRRRARLSGASRSN